MAFFVVSYVYIFLYFGAYLDIAFYLLNGRMGFTSVDFEKVPVATNII
ncbi:hypothetical protein N8E87_08120 [Avibacterium paragallinarum]|nr:hypothetical protein [Avibacterium paragallinarum]UXN36156.1 hypothetical protein N8E87_08120 [Avibacterium paragallinarum]